MSYTTNKLIANSWYLSGIVARNLQTITGDQLSDGLDMLNACIAFKTAQNRLIPYYTIYQLTLVAGQEEYFIPNLINATTVTFNIGTVRYSTIPQSRKIYFGAGRVDNIQSLPYNIRVERTFGGANLFFYFLPNSNFPATIVGKFSLNQVVLGQDLSQTLDLFYIDYLRYALANYMCEEYNIQFQPQGLQKLSEYEQIITDVSPIDLTMSKFSSLQAESGINYADVNIGRGWRP